MLGKEAIVRFFEHNDIGNIFHLPGIHTLPLDQEFLRHTISVFVARHESSMAFMADGYARATGRTGVMVVTPGPGLGNVVSGCMEAHGDDVPMLIIHVAIEPKDLGKGSLHELADPEGMFRNITKAVLIATDPGRLVRDLQTAYRTTVTGRPGPVLVSIPYTFFEKEVPYAEGPKTQFAGSPDIAPALAKALEGKERPVLIGGWALMNDDLRPALTRLCREHAIPFLTSTAGKGAVREDEPESFGNMMRKGVTREILARADVAIALGTRLRDVDSKRRGVKIRQLLHIDVDEVWMGRNYPVSAGAGMPMREAVEMFGEALGGYRSAWDLPALKTLQAEEEVRLARTSRGYAAMSMLRKVIPEDTMTFWDLNLISYWAEYYFPVLQQRTFFAPRGISPIFYAAPAAIGARIGRPDRPCLCVVGDGGGLPGLVELATVTRYKVPVVFLVYNNGCFGILDDYMRERYAVERAMDLTNPDFVRLAEAFGVPGARAETLEELERIFRRDVSWEEPFLVEYRHPVFPPPWDIT